MNNTFNRLAVAGALLTTLVAGSGCVQYGGGGSNASYGGVGIQGPQAITRAEQAGAHERRMDQKTYDQQVNRCVSTKLRESGMDQREISSAIRDMNRANRQSNDLTKIVAGGAGLATLFEKGMNLYDRWSLGSIQKQCQQDVANGQIFHMK